MKPRAWVCFDGARQSRVGWLVVAWLAVFATWAPAILAAEPSVITQAEILLGVDSAVPPPDSAAWQPISLPDIWTQSRAGVSGFAWYRLLVDLPEQPQGRQALYFARLRTVGAAFVNGHEVGQYGEFGVAVPGARPQLFDFSPALLQAGRNTLHVRLWVGPAPDWIGALAPVRIGPQATLAAAPERERFLSVTVPQFVAVIGAVLGAMMLVIWLGRRYDTMFGWFAVAALSKSLYIALVLGAIPGLPFSAVMALLAVPIFAPLSIYCLRYAGWHWPRFERLVWVLAICDALYWAALTIWKTGLPVEVADDLALFLVAAPLFLALVILRRQPGVESALLALAHLLSVGLMVRAIFFYSATGIAPGLIHALPLFLVMAWILTRRFVRSLNEAEMLNGQLERRVADKQAELERNAARVQQLARDAAVAAERQRIMSDMHDGIGGQLISTLGLVEAGEASKEQVAAALRECIDDLRLAIDSLEPTDEDLLPVLGNLRYRLESRLKAHGIELDRKVKDVPKLACLTPQNVLHVLRILQEAFTNVLKHAGASRIRVATRSELGRVLIDVSDNGMGMTGETGRPGSYGLANMRRRTEALGGELLLQPSALGTTVTLALPAGHARTA
jgi:signal transduction histidine kinase